MNNNKNNVQSLIYEGVVRLKIIDNSNQKIKKSFVIHNEGSNSLFYFLCSCLTKNYDNDYAPLAIDALAYSYDNNDTNTNVQSALAYRILLSRVGVLKDVSIKLDGEETEINYPYVANFNAMIPYHAIVTASGNNDTKTIKCIQLHSSLS